MILDHRAKNVRERISPHPADQWYLVLADLRIFLEQFRTNQPLRVLDYGAGTSPYRDLFPNAAYLRADYIANSDLDYLVPYDSTLAAPDELFDLVLSTQVAEHLPVPSKYCSEAFRVLKSGGRLILTTHGTWEDHGVPFDYQRWTAEGLRRDLEKEGFVVIGMHKLTTSYRFHLFLLLDCLGNCYSRKGGFIARALARLARSTVKLLRPVIHRIADYLWQDCRVVGPLGLERHRFYCIIAVEAIKPPDENCGSLRQVRSVLVSNVNPMPIDESG